MVLRSLNLIKLNQFPAALRDRLLDYEESVRKKVVSVVCDVVCHSLTSIPVETIKLVSERLRDKSVRRPVSPFLSSIFVTRLAFWMILWLPDYC